MAAGRLAVGQGLHVKEPLAFVVDGDLLLAGSVSTSGPAAVTRRTTGRSVSRPTACARWNPSSCARWIAASTRSRPASRARASNVSSRRASSRPGSQAAFADDGRGPHLRYRSGGCNRLLRLSRRHSAAGTFTAVSIGDRYGCALRSNGEIACWGNPPLGATPPPGRFTKIAIGETGNCPIAADRRIQCWGGIAGWHPPPGEFMDVAVGNPSQLAVGADGTLVEWGRRESRRTGDATQVAANYCQACVLNRGGAVECRDEKGKTSGLGGPLTSFAPLCAGGCGLRPNGTRGVSRRGRPTARNRAGAPRRGRLDPKSRLRGLVRRSPHLLGHTVAWASVRKAPRQRIDALTRAWRVALLAPATQRK